MCGVRRKHHASADSTFRPLPQPEGIEVLLQEVENFEGTFLQLFIRSIENACMQGEQLEVVQSIALQS